MPASVYLWPDLLGLMLRPLFEYQASSSYTNNYAAQDLGSSFRINLTYQSRYE